MKRNRAALQAEHSRWWILALFLLAVFAVYARVFDGGFLWDDDAHIWRNPALRSLGGLVDIWFRPGAVQQYYPVTYTFWWLQWRLWGLGTVGYHLINVLLHVLNAWLFWSFLGRMKVPGALLAGLIFALHPVHLESVAWLSEFKNVLSTAFFLLSLLAFLRFTDGRNRKDYWISFALYAAACLSKTTACVMPVAALALIGWRHGRLTRKDLRLLAPFLAMGLVLGLFCVYVEKVYIGASGAPWEFSALERCAIAGKAFWFYLGKLIWPVELSFVYPKWSLGAASAWPALLVPVSFAAALLASRRTGRASVVVWLCYAAAIFPALGFFNVYPMRFSFAADHYQYLASMAPIAAFAAACVWAADRAGLRGAFGRRLIAGLLLANLGLITLHESEKYHSEWDLWLDSMRKNPSSALVRHNFGIQLARLGRLEEARTHLLIAERLDPDFPQVQLGLAFLMRRLGRPEKSIPYYARAIELGVSDADIHKDFAEVLAQSGRYREPADQFRAARNGKF